MRRILITGGRGFLGRNLVAHLHSRNDCETFVFDQEDSVADLQSWLSVADVVFHLAGVNRPEDPLEFERGNAEFTAQLCGWLTAAGLAPKVVFASSVQAELENPYGKSKLKAEEALLDFAQRSGAQVRIFRLKNVFGKWCRANYNSVVATFCHNVAHGLPLSVTDSGRELELVYVDDVVGAFLDEMEMETGTTANFAPDTLRSYRITLGDLASRIEAFRNIGGSFQMPAFSQRFDQRLYATYLTHVDESHRFHSLDGKADHRGVLVEFLKSPQAGQLFVSRTKPGVTRGNHYHHTKAEKFFVVAGEGLVRMRHIEEKKVSEYNVRGEGFGVVDIPPGYAHSIKNTGKSELVTLFWASQMFDVDHPDTYPLDV